jgi:hypothetical protein
MASLWWNDPVNDVTAIGMVRQAFAAFEGAHPRRGSFPFQSLSCRQSNTADHANS